MIDKFRGNFYYLSNFYNAPITWEGITYKNNESAFQSAKLLDVNKRLLFANLNASDAKRKGRRVQLRPDWEKVKTKIMYDICYAKFTQNQYLKDKLLSTGNEYLIEGNDWNDTFWGVCNGRGYNNLGKILMQVRNNIKKER